MLHKKKCFCRPGTFKRTVFTPDKSTKAPRSTTSRESVSLKTEHLNSLHLSQFSSTIFGSTPGFMIPSNQTQKPQTQKTQSINRPPRQPTAPSRSFATASSAERRRGSCYRRRAPHAAIAPRPRHPLSAERTAKWDGGYWQGLEEENFGVV